MSQNAALVYVTYELLRDRLGLPRDVRILAVVQKPEDVLEGAVRLVVEHPKLPLRVEGAAPRTMTADALAQAVAV